MKLTYFRLQARPFPTTPAPPSYYAATPHEAVLDRLLRGVDDGEGLLLLTGAAGTGKTLVAHLLLERLGREINSALLTNCRFASRADLLRALLFDLGQPHQGLGEQELRLALTGYLLDEFALGKRTVVVLDEAQGLTPDLLEELRLLGNLEAGHGKAVQIVLVALPSIGETLARPELNALNQRLAVRETLEVLDLHESADYLLHQLRQASGRPERIMTDEAVSIIARTAHGVPRLLNRYAYQALALAEHVAAERVDAEVTLETLNQLGVEPELPDEELPTKPALAATAHGAEPLSAGGAPHISPRPAPSKESPWIAGALDVQDQLSEG
jgi:type II secretory pathway predicted ATPase ExeA